MRQLVNHARFALIELCLEVGPVLLEDLSEADPDGVGTRGTRIREHELLERVRVEVVVEVLVGNAGGGGP